MTALLILAVFIALAVASVVAFLGDPRLDRRPPEWSMGRLIEPRR